MSHNARIRTPGTWSLGTVVQSAEFESFDVAQFKSINGDDGGTWAPAAAIVIGGSGLQTTGAFTASGTTTISGALTASSVSSLTMSGTNRVSLASRSVTRLIQETPRFSTGPQTGWSISNHDGRLQQTSTSGMDNPIYDLRLPDGCTLTAVKAYVQAGTGHTGAPGALPSINVDKLDPTTVTNTLVGTASDTYGSQAAYEALHTFQITGLTEVIARTNRRYTVWFTGEQGSGSQVGYKIYAVEVTYTVTSMDDGQ